MGDREDGITRPPPLDSLDQQSPRQEARRDPRAETMNAVWGAAQSMRTSLVDEDAASGFYVRPPEVNIDVTLNEKPNFTVTSPGQGNVRGTEVKEEDCYNSPFAIVPSSNGSKNMMYADPGPQNRTGPLTSWNLQQHPTYGKYSPPCPELEPKENTDGPFPPMKAHVRTNSDSSGDGLPPEAEEEPVGHQEMAISGAVFDKGKHVFSMREEEPNCLTEADRLATFDGFWLYEDRVPQRRLARAGFVYLGRGDKVMCSSCKGILEGWKRGDDPRTEHKMWFNKDCF